LQRTEVLEAEEYFSSGQKGSSAMPHKRNPVLSENITGLARLVRSYVFPAMENIVLWHERDISHSSVERNIGPDATVTLDFLLSRLNGVVKNLVVHKDNMAANMNKFKGLVFSQGVMLKLTQKGVKREDAYKTVQYNAMKTWDNNEDFYTNLSKDKLIKKYLTTKELEKLFDLNYHTKNVNHIFSRVFK
jgi:adenylosuccinate lyase